MRRPAPPAATSVLDPAPPALNPAPSAANPASPSLNPTPNRLPRPYSAPLRPRPRLLPQIRLPVLRPLPIFGSPRPSRPCPRLLRAWSVAPATRPWEDPDVARSQHGGGGGRVRPEGARGALGKNLGDFGGIWGLETLQSQGILW